ncbi:hypothetical protein CDA63_10825 [Hymenobacter amundsenii]|uniref:Aldehyde dehydrogenase domain-containing protein n=1 Tax=Hymenobacter amundsenii TaxID=2006685 RepID=A0A246FKB5_9BACT|nr:hypothetical protein CDA63_10825 [Hymenobacter amundsenii]
MANSTDLGLSGAIHTRNLERGVLLARQIETGMVHVNDQTVNDQPNAILGGERGSIMGRFGGEWVMERIPLVQCYRAARTPRIPHLTHQPTAPNGKRPPRNSGRRFVAE